MQRYFFHVMDGRAIIDKTGTEFANLAAVRKEANELAGAILSQEETSVAQGHPWMMTVADADGTVVYSLRFEKPLNTPPLTIW